MSFPTHSVAELIEVQPRRHKLKTDEYQVTGAVPIVDQGAALIAGFTDALDRVYDGPLPVVIFGDHTCCLKYIDFPFAIGADGTQVLRPVDGVDARFLYFALHTANLEQFGYQRHFKLLKDSQISAPPLATQSRIASILGAYDDLIEVNRRRVAVLGKTARELFEEWFVRFRFPGHESVPLVDTPDGPLPQGWSLSPISAVYDRLFDGPHATPPPSNEGAVFLGIGNVTEAGRVDLSSVRHIAEQDLAKWTKRVTPQEGDIVFTYEATLNRYALIPKGFRGCLGRRMALIRCNSTPGMNRYLYHYFFTTAWREVIARNKLSGATVDRVPLTRFPEFPVLLPSGTVLQAYDAVAMPIVEQIDAIERSNRVLSASRDLLLPRLISGQLSVKAAERELELAA